MSKHQAVLKADAAAVFEPLRRIAEQNGFAVEHSKTRMVIDAPLGLVVMEKTGTETTVAFDAPSRAELQMLKELYAQRFDNLGFADGIVWNAPRASTPLNQVICKVSNCAQISPNFARVRLHGEFTAFAAKTAGLHFRFLFGPKGAAWPTLDEHGLTCWPQGVSNWHRPPYTVRKLGKDANWMDVDIVLHEGGRVTEWSKTVKAGDEIALTGPSGSKMPTDQNLDLFGDETALPVILRIIEDAHVNISGHATIAVRDRMDIQHVSDAGNFKIKWIDMTEPDALVRDLRDSLKTRPEQSVFFAAERRQADAARQLLKDASHPSASYRAASYWTKAT